MDNYNSVNMLKLLRKNIGVDAETCLRNLSCCCCPPRHLLCFKQWSPEMVKTIIDSAINLKCRHTNMRCTKLNILKNCKVTILKEVNEPILNLAVSRAASFMGADDVTIVDKVLWDSDYLGKVFSLMTDIMFVCTSTHMCLQRLADKSLVPVMCMQSRTHATIQSLATVMTVKEEFGFTSGLNFSYLGPAHPVLNSYLLLCPMLGANIMYKCCCSKSPVSPLLGKASADLGQQTQTISKACSSIEDITKGVHVLIAGPTTKDPEKIKEFLIPNEMTVCCETRGCHWIFIHTCPHGKECDEAMFNHCNARTYQVFHNMPYIVAALMAWALKDYRF